MESRLSDIYDESKGNKVSLECEANISPSVKAKGGLKAVNEMVGNK